MMMPSRTCALAILLALLTWGPGSWGVAHAQSTPDETYTLILRDVPLRQALEKLVATTQINLVYDSDLVDDKRIFCSGRNASPETLLHCILSGVNLDFFRTSSGTYVLTRSVRQISRYGRLAGRVVDEKTGEPLPSANVLLADASTGTATNEAGLFSFSSLLSGPHRIVVTYMGYRTHVSNVWVPPNDSARARIALHPEPLTQAPVVVTGLQQRLPSQGLGRGELTAGRIALLGDLGTPDVARGAGTLMGVSRQSPLAELHIQGGGTGEHQVQLDGIPIRNPVSLGRLLGAFSPLAIGRLTVHKAGFGVDHGSHIAGLISVEHDLTRPDTRLVTMNADPVSLNGRLQQPFTLPGGMKGTAMVAARTSMWNVYRDPALQELLTEWNTVDAFLASKWLGREVRAEVLEPHQSQIGVDFSDLHAAARLQFDPFHTLYVSGYRGRNRIGADFVSADMTIGDSVRTVSTRDRYDWTNLGGQARLEWLMGARAIGTLHLRGSQHTSRYDYLPSTTDPSSSSSELPDEDNRVNEVALKAEVDYSISSHHRVNVALEAARISSRFRAGNGFIRPLTYENASWRLAGHLQGELSIGLRTTLEGGTRLTFVPSRPVVYAEPRLALRYDRSQSPLGGYSVRIAGGLYRQFTNRFDLSSTGPTSVVPSIRFWLPVDESLAPPKSYHLATDLLLTPASHWTISAEGYYKWQPRILAVDYPALLDESSTSDPQSITQSAFIAPSRGYAYGGGLRVKYEGPAIQSTVSYNFSRSRRQFPSRFGDRMEPPPWDEPHRLALDADIPLGTGFATHLSWKGIWGRSWGFRRAYYDYIAPEADSEMPASFDLNNPSAQALPPLYRLDAGLSYTYAWGGVSLEARATLINVLDRANEFDWNLNPTEQGYAQVARTLPGRRPVFSLTVGY